MRYQILLTIFFLLLISETGTAQISSQTAVNQAVFTVTPDTIDLGIQSPISNFTGNLVTDEVVHFGMPIYNPRNLDAKMRYWWPSVKYHYNMPNAYPGDVKFFKFDDHKKKN